MSDNFNKKCNPSEVNKDKSKLIGYLAFKAGSPTKGAQYKILKTEDNDQIAFCMLKNGSLKNVWRTLEN